MGRNRVNDMTESRIIDIDLDGVLADSRKGFMKIVGQAPQEFCVDEMWVRVASIPEFFLRLDVTAEARALFAFVQTLGEVRILTATPRKTTYPAAADEKRRWTALHFGDVPVTIVQYAHQKADYARSGDVLIDDSPGNIRRWVKSGGLAIVHTDLDSTMAALLKIAKG
jgi:5'(3')-deoxyribonucleotidase